ncbi:MAG: bifunctional riboflavin kinase/FAD synthetase, partial [Saprospiraceae bacterium]|nr:bifunctional riboflavin kinase/FAD synthetase [Saprospiraceae bacterium]
MPSFRNTVLTIGSFDGVHTGHRRILDQVQKLAAQHRAESVVITFEPHPRTVLQAHDSNFKLITLSEEKIRLLEQSGVDHVVLAPFTREFARMNARAYVEDFIIRRFQPTILVIGYDHRFGANREGNIDFLREYERAGHFQIMEIPAQEVDDIAVSSTKIRRALDASQIEYANRLLGHPFSLTGAVVPGNQIGRKLGFPTANLYISDPYKLILPQGIYAARVYLESKNTPPSARLAYQAMLYIGNRPSIPQSNGKSIEVNLLDFEGDLYGQNLEVEVLKFIRPDKKLDDLEALQQQIQSDQAAILDYFSRQTAVVILNYNTREHLRSYLPSVLAHSRPARLVVADNGSPDDSRAVLQDEFPEVELLDLKKNYGFAQGYNQALAQVDADIYVILNSDVEVTAGWMEPVLQAMRANPAIAVAQPKILAWRDKQRFEYAGAAGGWLDFLGYPFCRGRIFSRNEIDSGQYDQAQECFWAAGAAFFIRAELYHAFGGFDSDY